MYRTFSSPLGRLVVTGFIMLLFAPVLFAQPDGDGPDRDKISEEDIERDKERREREREREQERGEFIGEFLGMGEEVGPERSKLWWAKFKKEKGQGIKLYLEIREEKGKVVTKEKAIQRLREFKRGDRVKVRYEQGAWGKVFIRDAVRLPDAPREPASGQDGAIEPAGRDAPAEEPNGGIQEFEGVVVDQFELDGEDGLIRVIQIETSDGVIDVVASKEKSPALYASTEKLESGAEVVGTYEKESGDLPLLRKLALRGEKGELDRLPGSERDEDQSDEDRPKLREKLDKLKERLRNLEKEDK